MSFTPAGDKVIQRATIEATNLDPFFDFDIEFDVSETEAHTSSAKVTQHPVETGAQISDHIINDSDQLELVAWVTNTPINDALGLAFLSPSRAEDAYQQLLIAKRAGASCAVTTTLRTYDLMLISEVKVTRNKDTGQALSVGVKLTELRTATSQTVQAPTPKMLRGNASTDGGKKTTTPVDDDEPSQTILETLGLKADIIRQVQGVPDQSFDQATQSLIP